HEVMLQIFPYAGELKTRALRWSPLLLIAILPMTYMHFRNGKTESKGSEFEVKVEKKEFRQLLRLNGKTQASRSFVVLAPRLEGEWKGTELEVQKNEVVSRIDAEKNLEAVEGADSTLKQLREAFAVKRAAGAAAVHIVGVRRDRAKGAIDYAQGIAAKMVVYS